MIYLLPSQFDCFRDLGAEERKKEILRLFPWLPLGQVLYFFGMQALLIGIFRVIAPIYLGCSSFLCAPAITLVLIFSAYLAFLNLFLYPRACKRFTP